MFFGLDLSTVAAYDERKYIHLLNVFLLEDKINLAHLAKNKGTNLLIYILPILKKIKIKN